MAQLAWPSPSIPILTSNSSHIQTITADEASYFSIIPPIFAIIATPITATLVDAIGRKKMIILITIPHIISWGIILTASNLMHLYISRAVGGISDAIIYGAIPAYVAEIATPKVRGTWGNLLVVFMFFGQFSINAIGAYTNIKTTALIFIIVPIIQLLFALFLPESPYFLIMKKKTNEAEKALKLLRWNQNVQDEFENITKVVQRQISEPGTIRDVFCVATHRKTLLICVALRIFQQFTGLVAFTVYTQQMFAAAGGNLSSSVSAIIYTGVLFIVAFGFLFVVHKFGRKQWLIFSAIGATIALFAGSIYFYLQFETRIDLSDVSWIPLAVMLFYICSCIGGIRILPTLIIGELFSSSVKGKATGIVNVTCFLCMLVVPKLFQYLQKNLALKTKVTLLFVHAISGCDSTSTQYVIVKQPSLALMKSFPGLRKDVKTFNPPHASHEEIEVLLDEARYFPNDQAVAKQSMTATFKLATVPPTSGAVRHYAYRAYFIDNQIDNRQLARYICYLDVQQWLGMSRHQGAGAGP
ncbi:hypothetical protein FQR65_LT09450 [Abscondita terminalis]|nr:hypothetical protein FQR65_LT09450 [Abscondita terminalis]